MQINSPCLNCSKRHMLCHDNCTSYKAFKMTQQHIKDERADFMIGRSIVVESALRANKYKKH